MKKLTVRGRFLAHDDGTPFFYLGDTAWEMLHRLNREEIRDYLTTRARQGFTVIQTVLLAEMEGVTVPNAHGRLPLLFTDGVPDPTRPDCEGPYSYWDHVDYALGEARRAGLYLALLPTWGDKFNLRWGKGPEIFTPENAAAYARFLAGRYRTAENVVWMLGGDRPLETEAHRAVIDAMARVLREEDGNHLLTFHPPGSCASTDFLADADYLDIHTAQTGHRAVLCYESDRVMAKMAAASPRPYMDSEPRYEDHPACFKPSLGFYWDDADVRQNAYWDVLAGACGHTYGNHCVWSMNRTPSDYYPYTWREALEHPGARQMQYVKALRLSHDYFSLRPEPALLAADYEGMGHMGAAVGDGYGYVYLPLGLPTTVDLSRIRPAEYVRAAWFDPRTGATTLIGILPPDGRCTLAPPTQGKGADWILVLEGV